MDVKNKSAMKQIKYILSTFVLLFPVLAHAQDDNLPIYTNNVDNGGPYKLENGIATRKRVSGPENGKYTLTLETFATGKTSLTQLAVPSDVVLVLDLSTSMGGHRGTLTELEAPVSLSYNDVMNLDEDGDCYVRWYDAHGFGYEVLGYERNGRYYLYWLNPSTSNNRGVTFFDKNGGESGTGTDNVTGATLPTDQNYWTTDPTEKYWTFPAGTPGKDHPVDPYDATDPDHANYCHATVHKASNARLRELKQSTLAFIDEIVTNDRYRIVNGQKVARDNWLGNRLSIVAFGGSVINDLSTNLLPLTDANVETLQNLVKSFTMRTGTKPADALSAANTRLTNRQGMTVGEDFMRTVVFFTDGKPDGSSSPHVNGNDAINNANTIKTQKGATIYSVGLFSGGDLKNYPDIPDFMSHVSSEWLNSTTINNGTQNTDGVQYYHDASDEDMSLADIFQTIAQSSGGAEKVVPGETRVVDAVSNSFKLPEGYNAAQVKVYTRSINAAGTAWGDPDPLTTIVLPSDDESYKTDDSKVAVSLSGGTVEVTGFNYSKDDSQTSYDGNWVGWRYENNVAIAAGNELMIQFEIEATDAATGGDLTNTNAPGSGILVPEFDENGNIIGWDNAAQYPFPRTDLPINLTIVKKGLLHGESATIQIYRAPMSNSSDDINPTTGKFGKASDAKWQNFSKVILTNKGEDYADVTKTLICLDASYVYLLEEDNWGFGYILDDRSIDTSEKETNPFVFENTLKVTEEQWGGKVVKHAEAVSINHFIAGEKPETYKSSKVESF